jgi:large subunit ribosomal protein L15
MPLYRRIPKFGFKNLNRVAYAPINLDKLQDLADKGLTTIDREVLLSNGLIGKKDLIKILGRGELKSAVQITADAFSTAAQKAVEAAGGSITASK